MITEIIRKVDIAETFTENSNEITVEKVRT